MNTEREPAPLRVTVMGLGYVGLTTAVGCAALGHEVTGVDVDCRRLDTIRSGRTPMHEPALQVALTEHLDALTFTSSLATALERRPHIVMIAVQTPGESSTQFVEQAARELAACLCGDDPATEVPAVVLRSTAPLGTARRVAAVIQDACGRPLPVASNPEFLVEGRAFEEFLHPDRIVIGVEDAATGHLLRRLYAGVSAPLVITDIATAELAKYAANAYLATQISFINEMADLAAAAGADAGTVSRVVKMDRRVGEKAYLDPGIGFGGSCLPKDLRTLTRTAEELGVDMRLARAVTAVNDERAARAIERLRDAVGDLAGRRVAVWGLAFKGGTNDVRDSPAIRIVQGLLDAGASVRAYDPLAEPAAEPLVGAEVLCDDLYEPVAGADALMVLTDCREFAAADLARVRELMAGDTIVDGRGVVPGADARATGFTYIGIGKTNAARTAETRETPS
jgi:UDPglucose 6-dehydrogenase